MLRFLRRRRPTVASDRRAVIVPGDAPRRYDEDALHLVLLEAQRVRASAVAASDGMRQRAALLAGTSSIAGALSIKSDQPLTWAVAALFAVATIAGVAVYWPATGWTVRPEELLPRAANYEAPQLMYMYIQATTKETLSIRRALRRSATIARVGLIALTLGVILAALVAIVPIGGGEPLEQPTPTAGPR